MPNIPSSTCIDEPCTYDGVLLGFDFGLRRIGVAVGQTLTRSARPLGTLLALDGVPNWPDVKKYIDAWRPKALIVGIPLHMDGSEQTLTDNARFFAAALKEHYNLPVHGIDERLTTKDARSLVFEQGGYKALTKQEIDAVAAALILETWINTYCE